MDIAGARRTSNTVALLVAAALSLGACDDLAGASGGSTGATSGGTATAGGLPAEGRYEDDLATATATLKEFYVAVAAELGMAWVDPIVVDARFLSETFAAACGIEVSAAVACFPSALTGVVAYNDSWMRSMHAEIGDASTWVVLAHEFGHHVVARWGLLDLTPPLSRTTGLEYELLADCLAGAFMYNSPAANLVEVGDQDEMTTTLLAVADSELAQYVPGSTRDEVDEHGTAEERIYAFSHGRRFALEGCVQAAGNLRAAARPGG